MNRKTIFLPLLLLALILPSKSQATHGKGMAVEYTIISPCTVRVTLKQYGSCFGIGHPLEPLVFVPDTTGCTPPTPLNNWTIAYTSEETNACWQIPSYCTSLYCGIGDVLETVRVRDYEFCSASNCDFQLSYSIWNRIPSSVNIVNPGNTHLTVTAGPFNPAAAPSNSSPVWAVPPANYISMFGPTSLHSFAVDPDGDSLVYSLTSCIDSSGNPVPYSTGFSPTAPMGPNWLVEIDSHTGVVTYTPTPGTPMQAQICIKVEEYRNGQLLGESTREMEIYAISNFSTNRTPVLGFPQNLSGSGYISGDTIVVCARDSVWVDLFASDINAGDSLGILMPYPVPWAQLRDTATLMPMDTVTGVNTAARLCFRTPSAGVFQIPLQVKDNFCPIFLSHERMLTVIAYAPGTARANTSSNCLEATFEADICGGPFNFSWSGNGGLATNPANNLQVFSHQYAAPGTYSWQLVVDSMGIVIDSLGGTVTVASNSTALPGLLTSGSPVPCDLTPVSLSATTGFSSYLWSNGSTASSISTSVPGFYSVSVTDSLGCEFTDTLSVVSDTTPDISGFISTSGGGPLANQTVILIRLDTIGGGFLTAIDTTVTDGSGYYKFCDVADSVVYVKALPTWSAYPGELPTYADSSLFWNTATPFSVTGVPYQVNFATLPGDNPGGPGFIGGLVSQGANKTTGPGDPVAGLDIILRDASSQTPVAHTRTDSTGYFSFGNLPIGDYEVAADWPWVDEVNVPVIPLSTWPTRDSLDFRLHSTYFEWVQLTQVPAPAASEIRIYPNPARHLVHFSFASPLLNPIEIHNQQGQIVRQFLPTGSTHTLHTADMTPGIYFVRIPHEGGVIVRKLVLLK